MVANASTLLQTLFNGGTEMNAAVQPRYASFVGGGPEAGKLAGFHTIALMCSILEGEILAKEPGQDRGCCAGLGAVPTGIFRKGRRYQQWLPSRVNDATDISHRPHQIVVEFRIPTANEGIGKGDAKARQYIHALLKVGLILI
jgi:hypothetical protein